MSVNESMSTVAKSEWCEGEEHLEVCPQLGGRYWHLEVRFKITKRDGAEHSAVDVVDDRVRWLRGSLTEALKPKVAITPTKGKDGSGPKATPVFQIYRITPWWNSSVRL